MCCDGWQIIIDDDEYLGECPDCGAEAVITKDGSYPPRAYTGCNYSPVVCETCGDAPCDYSC